MEGTKNRIEVLRGVGASKRVRTLLLLAFDLFTGLWGPVGSSCSLVGLTGGLLQGFRQAQDSGAIAMKI